MKDFLLTLFCKHIDNIAEKFLFIFLKMLNLLVKGICQTLGKQFKYLKKPAEMDCE